MRTEPPRVTRPGQAGIGLASALALAALASIALVAVAGCKPKADAAPPAASATPHNVTLTRAQLQHIQLFTVEPAGFHKTVEASGVVDFDNDQATSVLAPFSGPVSRLLVQPGQRVRAGEALALVSSPDYSAAIGAYAKASTTARTARRVADMDKDLLAHQGIAAREAQQAQTDAANAESDRDAALQALVALGLDAGTIRSIQQGRSMERVSAAIRSPISGTVVEKLITPGQLLQAGTTPSFTVANLSRVWVMAQIPSTDLASVRVGDPVEIETPTGSAPLSGVVDNISALVNPDTRAVLTRVVVANPGELLKKQMYVRVRIQSRQGRSGLLVPVSAVLRDDLNLPFVYVADPHGGFARRHVTLGERTGGQFEISEGVQPGDRVVSDGAIFVQFVENQ